MDLVNNGDKELVIKLVDVRGTGRFFHPTEKVVVECEAGGMLVRKITGCIALSGGNIRIECNPFNWFGLKRIAPFHQRVQDAVDKLQRECDEDMWQKIRQYEMNQQLNPRAQSTPPQGGSGVPPKTNFANNAYVPPTITPEDARL
ncbi:MAG: hypothetical protein KAJ03_09270 [Gammaproteobacteria bacterium]|nr:hypothetical protein [Gammaproteobacteria bacterium]